MRVHFEQSVSTVSPSEWHHLHIKPYLRQNVLASIQKGTWIQEEIVETCFCINSSKPRYCKESIDSIQPLCCLAEASF
jgi:hypothetical protein